MKRSFNILIRIFRFILFSLYYFKELFVASVLLAWDIIRPHKTFSHGIIGVDLDLVNDTAIIAFVNLVSMTPGSLSVELTQDKTKLYIHAMYLDDPDKFRQKIKNKFERKIKMIFE